MESIDQLTIKIFADGADQAGMLAIYRNPIDSRIYNKCRF